MISGPNAAGKTNILEAVHMLSSARSFKASYDKDVISKNKDFARIEGTVEDEGDTDDLEIFVQESQS